ncbi:MAG: hypothetical protein IPH79_09215 [Sphingomonadales bacterium]|nr:hypothetical protein [Sphingomonadales bacterium]
MANLQQKNRSAQHFYVALNNWKSAAMDVEAVCPDDNADKYEAEVDRLADIEGELQDAVFKYRSPDLAAAIAKLELAIYTPESISADHIRSAIADLAGIADVTVSPAFCANVWLCQFERRGGSFDFEPVTKIITLHANYDKRAALAMLNDLSDIQREALRASIIGNTA